ncbi:TolC family outer membrane protein [Tatumella sp. JGM118]|nr:TolC family outer membrane protein [Tatumella sp. JGM118]
MKSSKHLILRVLSPLFLMTTVTIFKAQADTAATAGDINTQALEDQQSLPDLSDTITNTPPPPASGIPDMNYAVQQAEQWHPAIGQAVGKLFQQAAKVDQAKAKYYPQVSAGMNNGYSNSYVNAGYSPSLVLSVSQMLYDFGKVSSSVRAANAGLAQQQANVMVSIDQVAHDTASAVVQVQGYQKLVTIAQQQLSALQHIGTLIQQRNTAGASSLSDVVQTNTRIEGARATLMQYQSALQRWRATLATDMGTGPVSQVADTLPSALTDACNVRQIDYREIPSVLAAFAQRNQAQADLDNANAQMRPTLSLEPQVTHYLNNNYSDSRDLNKTQYSAWVKLEMPLYQGGGLTASRDAAIQTLESARAAIRLAQLEADQKLTESQEQALNLYQTLSVQERQETLGEKTRDLYEQQYLQLGTRPLLDLLNVEQEIYQSRFTREQTLAQLHSLQLDCLYSTGKMRNAFALNNRKIQGVVIRP